MKKILFILVVILSLNCFAQDEKGTAILDDDENLVGIATKANFTEAPFKIWFHFNYEDYEMNEDTVEKLAPLLNDITIKAFMGTWCSDSQEQTPAFYKVLDAAEFNYENLEMVAVDEDKKTPNNLQQGLNIERVPTFIFYKNGVEIGRFVEYPRESVEADIFKIISGQSYKHSYEDE